MKKLLAIGCLWLWIPGVCIAQKPLAQYPSPMSEAVRLHKRVHFDTSTGTGFFIHHTVPKPVFIYIPEKIRRKKNYTLFVHFFGSPEIVAHAAEKNDLIGVAVNLGSGSSVYAAPFKEGTAFKTLMSAIQTEVAAKLSPKAVVSKLYLSAFSAGYGAVRQILSNPANIKAIDGILLLDALHTGYIPDRKLIADGGVIDSSQMQPFLSFAELAIEGRAAKKFLLTHSEIFPGTFSSTTETADYMAATLNMTVKPILKWGPGGMQQIRVATKNNVTLLGFAGNTAPDHMDHLHNLSTFMGLLKK